MLVVGPLPPPINGMTTATGFVLNALRKASIQAVHVDTGERRSLKNVARLDLRNVVEAIRVWRDAMWLIMTRNPRVLYLPVSQNELGFGRDALILLVARLLGIPRVVHLHGGYFDQFFRSTNRLVRFVISASLGGDVRAAVLCPALRRCFAGLVPDHRVHVVPNGIDISIYETARPRISDGFIRVLYLSTLLAEKGVLDVLRAAAIAVPNEPRLRFAFAGEWYSERDQAEAAEIIRISGIDQHVEWRGVVAGQRKVDELARADIFVLPTRYPFEGQPYSLMEAMAAGLPIVSTQRACLHDMVQDDRTGIVVPEGSSEAIGHALLHLARNPSERLRYGEGAKALVRASYTLSRWEQQIVELLEAAGARRHAD